MTQVIQTSETVALEGEQAAARARMARQTLALQARLAERVMGTLTALEAVEPPKTYGEVAQAARAIQGLARAQKAVNDLVPPPVQAKGGAEKTAKTVAAPRVNEDAGFKYDFDDGLDEGPKTEDLDLRAIFEARGIPQRVIDLVCAPFEDEAET
ncbi:MAG: hypothetical protein ACK41P_02825 [Asticcacaulis sp.]